MNSSAQKNHHPTDPTISNKPDGGLSLDKPVKAGRQAPQAPEPPKQRKTVNDYVELIETVARVEYSRLPNHLVDYGELVNIGAIAIHVMLESNPNREYNVTYLSTAMKWAIRNELRNRYKWYANKHAVQQSDEDDGEPTGRAAAREAVYETVLSMDSLLEAENPVEIKDQGTTPDEQSELSELATVIRECISKLPERERMVVEARFYKNLKMREIGQLLGISPSRTSRIVQSGLDKVKVELLKRGYNYDVPDQD